MLNTIELQTLQLTLHQASTSHDLLKKQDALVSYKTRIGYELRYQHESIFKNVVLLNGGIATSYTISFYKMTEFEVNMHIQAANILLNSEIQKRSHDLTQYHRAESILFTPDTTFTKDQTLYINEKNETLNVEDLLKVAKYSIAFAEAIDPKDKNKEFANAAITVFQGIESTLNNENQPIPIGKKLHIANGFLSTIVKASIKDTDTKRGITIASTLIDLVIDFCIGK